MFTFSVTRSEVPNKPVPTSSRLSNVAVAIDLACRWLCDAAEYFEQSCFPGAISPDPPQNFGALAHQEGRPEAPRTVVHALHTRPACNLFWKSTITRA